MLKLIYKSLFTSLFVIIISFIFSVVISRVLGADGRGLYSSIVMIATLVMGVSQFGLPESLIYYKRKKNYNILTYSGVSSILVALVSSILAFIVCSAFLPENLLPYNNYVLVTAILLSIFTYFSNLSQVHDDLVVYNLCRAIVPTLNVCLLVILYVFLDDVNEEVALKSNIISYLICLVFLISYIIFKNEKPNVFEYAKIKFLCMFGIKYWGTTVLGMFIMNLDKIYLMNNGTMFDFGVYAVAYSTSRLISIIPQTLSTIIYSKFSGRSESELDEFVRLIFSLLFIPFLSITAFAAIFISPILPFIYGEDFEGAIVPFSILVIECTISSFSWILAQRFNAAGKPGIVFMRQFVSIIPILIIFIIDIEYEVVIFISLILLLSSIIRLVITLIMYNKILRVERPRIIPSYGDFEMLKNKMRTS